MHGAFRQLDISLSLWCGVAEVPVPHQRPGEGLHKLSCPARQQFEKVRRVICDARKAICPLQQPPVVNLERASEPFRLWHVQTGREVGASLERPWHQLKARGQNLAWNLFVAYILYIVYCQVF